MSDETLALALQRLKSVAMDVYLKTWPGRLSVWFIDRLDAALKRGEDE
jgi:hypothetical protein